MYEEIKERKGRERKKEIGVGNEKRVFDKNNFVFIYKEK